MPWGLYEAIAEALEVMADKDLMANLRQSILEMETGEALSWEDAKLELAK
jgi:hypothetical protein